MDLHNRCTIILFFIRAINSVGVSSQLISLGGSGEAVQDREYTLECKKRRQIAWFKEENFIGADNNDECGFYHLQSYETLYKFKDCGVKQTLTIKSIDYIRDNGKVWRCQDYNNGNIYSNFKLTVRYPIFLFKPSQTAIDGQSFAIRCDTDIIGNLKWYRDEEELSVSYTGSEGCQYGTTDMYQFKKCESTHYLTITAVNYNRDNNARFQCRAGVYNSFNYTLTVNVLPRFTISTTPVHGESFDLICISTLSVTWYRTASGGSTITDIGTSYVVSNGCSVQSNYNSDYEFKSCGSVNQTLTIKSVDFNRDNGSTWVCYNNEQIYDTYILTVTVPVSSVEIKSSDLDLSTIRVKESQQISIQCITSFAYPEPVVDLLVCNNGLNSRCYNYTATKSSGDQTSITFQVTLNSTLQFDDTRLYCTARNTKTGVIDSSSVRLYILHHPRVRVQEDEGNLLCIAVGRPENMIFLPWRHSIDNKLVREIEGYYINTTVYSLNITNNQNDGGNYTCTVNNGISDPNTKQLSQKAYYKLDLIVQPTLYTVESDNNLVVGQNGTFSLKYLEDKPVNVSWYHNDTDLQTSGRITIREEPTEISHPYNNNIKLSGIKTILTITSITITDQGNYTCQVCNQYGCSRNTFDVDVVLMRKQASENAEITDVKTTIIGASVGATVLLICIVVIIFIVVFKRRTKSGGQSEGKRKHTQGSHDGVVENPGTPQLIITENDLYVSSDIVLGQPQNNVPVEMEIIENDLYISSDLLVEENTNDPPVYTQVKKAPQNVTTYDNNIPPTSTDSSPGSDVARKKKAGDDVVYYNTSSDAVSYGENETGDPYVNAEYINRKEETGEE